MCRSVPAVVQRSQEDNTKVERHPELTRAFDKCSQGVQVCSLNLVDEWWRVEVKYGSQ